MKHLKDFNKIDINFFFWLSSKKQNKNIKSFFKQFLFWTEVFKPYCTEGKVNHNHKYITFFSNENEKNIVLPILNELKNKCSESNATYITATNVFTFQKLPYLFFAPYLFIYFFLKKGWFNITVSYRAFIYYSLARKMFINPEAVFLQANDHNMINTCFFYAAKDSGLKTIYIQHADVYSKLPPLRHDFAFLDGLKAVSVYKKISSDFQTKIILSGAQRKMVLPQETIIKEFSVKVGLGIGGSDYVDKILPIFQELLKSYEVIIKIHPRFIKKINVSDLEKKGFIIVDNLSSLFTKVNVLITTPSSLILDASANKVNCIQLKDASDVDNDYYEFYSNNLCEQTDLDLLSIEQLIRKLAGREFAFKKALSFYDHFAEQKDHVPSKFVANNILNLETL